MDSSINMIADIQNNIINWDCKFDDIDELNKCMALENEVILNVNIKGLGWESLLVCLSPFVCCLS